MQPRSNIGRLLYVLPCPWSSSDEPLYAQLAHVAERQSGGHCGTLLEAPSYSVTHKQLPAELPQLPGFCRCLDDESYVRALERMQKENAPK
jgi:hypothetical protein